MIRLLSCFLLLAAGLSGQVLLSVGDSIGEGVQSAIAAAPTQRMVYSKLVANQIGAEHPLPLISNNPIGTVFSTSGRSRLQPSVAAHNLAVNGADVSEALRDTPTLPVDSETDLVLLNYSGSQVEIVESLSPDVTLCWIGNNDALSSILSFRDLDASQLTPIAEFQADFQELAQRLAAASPRLVFANIPNLTSIAYAMDADDLAAYAGSDFGLPPGHLTSLVAATALRIGLADASLLTDPGYVLDPSEVAAIQARINVFNDIIAANAAAVGAPVVDVAAIFDDIEQNGLEVFGLPFTTDFLGGIFSLDGVHPSNSSHAIVANQMIGALNAAYGLSIPKLQPAALAYILYTDPHVDKDGDGRVSGRPLVGLLETVAPLVGISGDLDDTVPNAPRKLTAADGRRFVERVEALTGRRNPRSSFQERALEALAAVFDLKR